MLKELLIRLYRRARLIGLDPLKLVDFLRGLPLYLADLRKFRQQREGNDFNFGKIYLYPSLDDRFSESGNAKGHYFHQDLLIARRIHLNNPKIHGDIGSRIDGFVAHVASFRPIEVFDVRPQSGHIENINFVRCDLTKSISEDLVEYCDSLSCLHALEHFGLGEYGDIVMYDGHLLGWNNLFRILRKRGKFYFSVPIGPQRIEFNSHRVFSVDYFLEIFDGKYRIDFFSFVDDKGDLHENVKIESDKSRDNFGCNYGCGIFEMTKL